MLRFLWLFLNFMPGKRAQAMTEYILIIALISLVMITILVIFRNTLWTQLDKIIQQLGGPSTPPPSGTGLDGDTGSSGASTRGVC